MERLLSCPICGKIPNIQSLEPKYSQYKYFCGVHVSCGEWKETEELAAADWNKRVQEYTDAIERLNTPSTPEFLERQGNLEAYAYCEDCEYETDIMTMKNLLFKLCMEGGYIVSDKNGGYFSQCPKCGSENLTLEK